MWSLILQNEALAGLQEPNRTQYEYAYSVHIRKYFFLLILLVMLCDYSEVRSIYHEVSLCLIRYHATEQHHRVISTYICRTYQ